MDEVSQVSRQGCPNDPNTKGQLIRLREDSSQKGLSHSSPCPTGEHWRPTEQSPSSRPPALRSPALRNPKGPLQPCPGPVTSTRPPRTALPGDRQSDHSGSRAHTLEPTPSCVTLGSSIPTLCRSFSISKVERTLPLHWVTVRIK